MRTKSSTAARTGAASSERRPSSHVHAAPANTRPDLPGQVVLVLQGGGALGAYQAGVYEALHEAGIEPDWVIGTSIGAINASLIAGNPPERRLQRLNEFWEAMERGSVTTGPFHPLDVLGLGRSAATLATVVRGIPDFFTPNLHAWRGQMASLGVEQAAYYSTSPLRATLADLVDVDYLCQCRTRMTVGAVNVVTGHMRYFDTRHEALTVEHVMASGALPPAFGAIRIDGQPY